MPGVAPQVSKRFGRCHSRVPAKSGSSGETTEWTLQRRPWQYAFHLERKLQILRYRVTAIGGLHLMTETSVGKSASDNKLPAWKSSLRTDNQKAEGEERPYEKKKALLVSSNRIKIAQQLVTQLTPPESSPSCNALAWLRFLPQLLSSGSSFGLVFLESK